MYDTKSKGLSLACPFSCVRCLVSFTRRRSLRVLKTSQAAAWLGVRRRRLLRFRVVASRSVPVPGLDFEATSLRDLGRLHLGLLARWFDSERRRLQARSRLPTVAFVRVSRFPFACWRHPKISLGGEYNFLCLFFFFLLVVEGVRRLCRLYFYVRYGVRVNLRFWLGNASVLNMLCPT